MHRRKSTGLEVWRPTDAATFAGSTIFGDYNAAVLWQARTSTARTSASTLTLRQSFDKGSTWNTARTKSVGASEHDAGTVQPPDEAEGGHVLETTISNAIMEDAGGVDMVVKAPAGARLARAHDRARAPCRPDDRGEPDEPADGHQGAKPQG